jgi:hypothetical protein
MTIRWGATALPLAAPTGTDAVTDKAASTLLAYFKAFLNAYAPTAWHSVFKSQVPSVPITPVKGAFVNEPSTSEFNERDLPGLFIWRVGGDDDWIADDWRIFTDNWKLLWVFPTAVQGKQQARDPAIAGLSRLVSMALKRGRDPAYQRSDDTDTTALDVAALPTSLKTSIATTTSAQSYSGAGLDGSIGTATMDPARAPTVTTSGDLSAFVVGSTVRFTGLNTIGMDVVSTVTLGAALGTFAGDYDLASVTAIDADAQASTDGTWTFGTAARSGLGSVVMRHAGMVSCLMTGWRKKSIPVDVGGVTVGDPPVVRHYDALEIDLRTEEKLEEDIDDQGNALNQVYDLDGVDISERREDTTEIESAQLDA